MNRRRPPEGMEDSADDFTVEDAAKEDKERADGDYQTISEAELKYTEALMELRRLAQKEDR